MVAFTYLFYLNSFSDNPVPARILSEETKNTLAWSTQIASFYYLQEEFIGVRGVGQIEQRNSIQSLPRLMPLLPLELYDF